MRKAFFPIFILFGIVALSSCERIKEDLQQLNEGYLYFPLEIGKYIVYDVDSTYWDDFLRAEIHHRSQMRYDVVDSFSTGGKLSYVINVLYRETTSDPFVPNDVIYATVDDGKVIVTQKNKKFIKMVFPVEEGKSWDGNAMLAQNAEDNVEFTDYNWLYSYSNVNEVFDPGNNVYEHTVTVNQIDESLNDPDLDSTAYAYRNYAQEKYAYNVGMIYRERIYWVFQPKSEDGQSGGSGYRKGYGVIMKAVESN